MFEFPNQLGVFIDYIEFKHWAQIRIERSLDAFDSVELNAAFEPTDPFFKMVFRPFTFKSMQVTVDRAPFFSGTMALVVPDTGLDKSGVRVGAYSKPGVLGECTASAADLPTEYRNQTLHQIALTLLAPFALTMIPKASPGPPFKKVALGASQTILTFLADLARQRNQVITNDLVGNVVFQQALPSGPPVAMLEEGAPPMVNIAANFSTSRFYSQITGLKPTKVRARVPMQFTWRNTLLPGVYRPYLYEEEDVNDAEIVEAVIGKGGRMWGNAVGYTVSVSTWRNLLGRLWEPNTFVSVMAPSAMVYKPYLFLIKRVVFRMEAHRETAELELTVPGAFTGVPPAVLPWDG